MPSVNVDISWPDGERKTYYSPSTIIHEYIHAKSEYELNEFEEKIFAALEHASERVYQKFGYYCSAASDEKSKIKRKLDELRSTQATGKVLVNAVN